jgi:hypothetical protein
VDGKIKARFALAIGENGDPKTIPQHVIDFYDDAIKVYYPLTTFNQIPRDHWPLMAILAERFKALEVRLDALEATKTETVGADDVTVVEEFKQARQRGRPKKQPAGV